MSLKACFWGLLSIDNLHFVYLPQLPNHTYEGSPIDLLLSQSLLEFVHPEERPMAKVDLSKFIELKPLAGAVTRCRLLDITNLKSDSLAEEWVVTDIVMYSVMNKILLAFFHDLTQEACCLDKKAYCLKLEDVIQAIRRFSFPIQSKDLSRVFQLYCFDKMQISWPLDFLCDRNQHNPFYSFSNEQKQFVEACSLGVQQQVTRMRQTQPNHGCFQHIYLKSSMSLEIKGLCEVEKIIIHYGPLIFASFHITPKETKPRRPPSIPELLNNSPPQRIRPKPLKACIGRWAMYNKKCERCQTSESPEWRKGPSGHKSQSLQRVWSSLF
ncbi:hypothetical protein BY458DRAFT_487795 [Sporodiniella umbellata]|nr:hypothetical protein BY458DRAFT_487795 [Sporodiniella umbellata]